MNIKVKCPGKLGSRPGEPQKICNHIFTVTVNEQMSNAIRCPECRYKILIKFLHSSRWQKIEDEEPQKRVIVQTVTHTRLSRGGSVRNKYSKMLTKKVNRRKGK